MAEEMLEKNMDVQKKVIFVWIVSEFGNRIMKIYVNYVYDGISDGQVIFTERKFCPNGLISLIKLGWNHWNYVTNQNLQRWSSQNKSCLLQ